MNKKSLVIGAFVIASTVLLSGCVSMDKNEAIVKLQAGTALQLGLASSDEITISKVVVGEKNTLGSQDISYRATTTKGRTFDCSALLRPGTVLTPADVTGLKCTPRSVHK